VKQGCSPLPHPQVSVVKEKKFLVKGKNRCRKKKLKKKRRIRIEV